MGMDETLVSNWTVHFHVLYIRHNYTGYSSSNESVPDTLILTNTVPMLEPFVKGMYSGYAIRFINAPRKYFETNLWKKLLVLFPVFGFLSLFVEYFY